MKILFIVPYCSKGPSNRYRVEQYLPFLRREGMDFDIRPFARDEFYDILYRKGKYVKKAAYFLCAFARRAIDALGAHKYDVIFIHREACPFGPPLFEWLFYLSGKPIIFDFDDAIFLQNFHPTNRIYRSLKFSSKTKHIIRMASVVIAANRFLEEYARRFNKNVHVIPTSVDTDIFVPNRKNSPGTLTIGWVGSPTTASYLRLIYSALKRLGQKYDFVFKVVGADSQIAVEGVKVQNSGWEMGKEIEDFQSIDIGVYPLPDTEWARGKASFKAIQYMAVGVPVVASPVGMNAELIQEGINGFLAAAEEEWFTKISRLIEYPELRRRISLEGRRTVEEKFSVKVNSPRYLAIIKGMRQNKKIKPEGCKDEKRA